MTSVKAPAITIPLGEDYRQDMPALIKTTKKHYREVGFVYLCNPNNPTGRIVTQAGDQAAPRRSPEGHAGLDRRSVPSLRREPDYATSVPYVLEGRPVIIARTFSKIAALAGMRLGYAIAPREIIQQMRPFSTGTINAIVKWGGVAALKDTESQAQVKRVTIDLRNKTTKELQHTATRSFRRTPTSSWCTCAGRSAVIEEFSKKESWWGVHSRR